MAKNFCHGPAWVSAARAARLGPLSYLVVLEDQQLWRRHVDHIKGRIVVEPSTDPHGSELELENPRSAGVQDVDPVQQQGTGETPLNFEIEPAVVQEFPPLMIASDTPSISTATDPPATIPVVSRTNQPYSLREHRAPPNYYRPEQ